MSSLLPHANESKPSVCRSLERNIEGIVREAAGTRALHVHVERRSVRPVAAEIGVSAVERQRIRLGVRVDAAQVQRAVDMGPSADDARAVKAFRSFWGEKSELRRFPVRFPGLYTSAVDYLHVLKDSNVPCRTEK